MRQCPTLPGDDRPLFAHSVTSGVCMRRQREYYHKCHRCVFRGESADFVVDPKSEAPHRNGVVRPLEVEVDRNAPVAAERQQETRSPGHSP